MISLEKVLSPQNMLLACKRVRANKGAPGVDGMTVDELEGHFRRHWASICAHIRAGRYIPSPVKRVDIPKPDGGMRMLGIPTVQDRLIQQAIAQVLVEHFDPTFSEFSYRLPAGPQCTSGYRANATLHSGRTLLDCRNGPCQILRYRQSRSSDLGARTELQGQDAHPPHTALSPYGYSGRRPGNSPRRRYAARVPS